MKKCKLYRGWKKRLNSGSGGFREFMGRVASRISRSDFDLGPCESEEEETAERVEECRTPDGDQPSYKVVAARYLTGAGQDKRLRKGRYSKAPEHTPCSTMNTKGRCALCCELCEKKKYTNIGWGTNKAMSVGYAIYVFAGSREMVTS